MIWNAAVTGVEGSESPLGVTGIELTDSGSGATRILAAAAQSDAAFSLDGRMVDAPVLARARRILGD